MKKFTAILLAVILTFSVSVVAFAADVYTCPTCNKKYEGIEAYNACIANHSEPVEDGEIYECGTCHKKYDNISDYNDCVDTHFNNINYHYDKYIDLTVVELINSFIDIFNSTGVKELFTGIIEKVVSLLGGIADSGIVSEIAA